MTQEDNSPENLMKLWSSDEITTEEYFFRLKANELNIKTFKF